MDIENIEITKLYVSNINVRKTLTCEEDETGISDLANDINTNGLINPITVRLNNDKYEIIAGQRRYLAMKQLNRANTCRIQYCLLDGQMAHFDQILNQYLILALAIPPDYKILLLPLVFSCHCYQKRK